MLAVAKKPRTKKIDLEIRGKVIPVWIIEGLRKRGEEVTVKENLAEGSVNVRDTVWFREMQASDSPARSLRVYRERDGLSQSELGKMIDMSNTNVSEMERGVRGISKATAKKLSNIFKVPVDRFI